MIYMKNNEIEYENDMTETLSISEGDFEDKLVGTNAENYVEGNMDKTNAGQCLETLNVRNNQISCSVQGSFHQADPLFLENSGTQCVANCLAGLAYHKLKHR